MKSSKNFPNIPSLIKSFLIEHLLNNQNASLNTVKSYGEVIRLLMEYLQNHHQVQPEKVNLKDLTAKNILGFLDYLQRERNNSIRTRNSRLAVIRSFVNYLLLINPVWSADLQGILAIPKKKSAKRVVDYLSQEEINLLLEAPDPATWSGQRDRVLLLVMYNTGARVSEIIRLKVSDVKLESRSGKIHLYGKGRKERSLPLWRNTVKLLKEWIKKNGYAAEMPLIPNSHGKFMSRWGITDRLSTNVSKVAKTIRSFKTRSISPHMIRHTTAMHFLQSGIDITTIAMWLGHESIETTQIYVTADMEMKEKALKTLQEPKSKQFRYKPSDSLLKFLENL